jgi:hypothetical protein
MGCSWDSLHGLLAVSWFFFFSVYVMYGVVKLKLPQLIDPQPERDQSLILVCFFNWSYSATFFRRCFAVLTDTFTHVCVRFIDCQITEEFGEIRGLKTHI